MPQENLENLSETDSKKEDTMPLQPLLPEELRRNCNAAELGFSTTADLSPLTEFVDQDVALDSLAMGLGFHADGYHVMVVGSQGSGRNSVLRKRIEQIVRAANPNPVLTDVCYVCNFDNAHKPKLVMLPAGKGQEFKRAMRELAEAVARALAEFLRSKDLARKDSDIENSVNEKFMKLVQEFVEQWQQKGVPIQMQRDQNTGAVYYVYIVRGTQDSADSWIQDASEEEQEKRRQLTKEVQDDYMEIGRQMARMLREGPKDLQRFKEKETQKIIGPLFAAVARKGRFPEAQKCLEELKRFVLGRVDLFSDSDRVLAQLDGAMARDPRDLAIKDLLVAFRVNVVLDNGATKEVPVIDDPEGTAASLFGDVKGESHGGVVVSDHTKITGGSVLRARDGVLILDAAKVVVSYPVWQKLVGVLKHKELKIGGDFWSALGVSPPLMLEPEPIPVTLKVVLICPADLFHLIREHPLYQEDVRRLFHAKVEFKQETRRGPDTERQYAQFVAMCASKEDLLPFLPDAVARIIEYGARLAGHREKLSLAFTDIKTLALEAHYAASQEGAPQVSGSHVRRAIEKKISRVSLPRDAVYDRYRDGTFLFDASTARVGQVNGLAVYDTGESRFAVPVRITARHYRAARQGGLLSVDKEAKLAGPHFEKAVGIINAWLRSRYGDTQPLEIVVSIAFEQSYGGVEGDSASAAKTIAALSSLSGVPLNQKIAAVTGSMNQNGEVQPIGAVNEKVEGFFDVCAATCGIDGHGVIIPVQNVQHLMLREDVVQACEEGRFFVYPISTIEEAIAFLSNLPMEEIDRHVRKTLAKKRAGNKRKKNESEEISEEIS